MIGCYANRAACYLRLNQLHDCKADCSSGISEIVGYMHENKLQDIEESLRGTLIKLYLRRSAVLTEQGCFSEALIDCQTAKDRLEDIFGLGCSPPNGVDLNDINADIARLENVVTADKLKKEADASFGDGNLDLAIEKYTEALEIVPCHVSCLSNRSACFMALGDLSHCLEDCSSALDILELNVSQLQKLQGVKSRQLTMSSALIPPVGTQKRKDWTLKTLARRGAANIQLGNIEDAIRDYGFAVSIDPSNEALKTDLTRLKNTYEFSSTTQIIDKFDDLRTGTSSATN